MARATATKDVSKTVGENPQTPDNAPEKVTRTKKPDWDYKVNAKDADGNRVPLDENDRMNGVPVNWDKAFAPIPRMSFSSRALQLQWMQLRIDQKIIELQEKRAELELDIQDAIRGPDPRRQAERKVEKLKKQLAELTAQLEADGVKVE